MSNIFGFDSATIQVIAEGLQRRLRMVIGDQGEDDGALHMLTTKKEVIDTLGGYAAVAKHFGVTHQAPHNWVNYMDHIPSRLYVEMMSLLAEEGCTAPNEIWGMWPYRHRRPDGTGKARIKS